MPNCKEPNSSERYPHADPSPDADEPFIPEREFIGYGMTPPSPRWPKGALIAVNFLVNHNVGAESNPMHGAHEFVESHLIDIPHPTTSETRFDMVEGQLEYGGRQGVPRLLELFKKHDIKATWNVSTHAFTLAPFWAKKIVEGGHEISSASRRYIDYFDIEPEVEDADVRAAIQTLQAVTGDKTIPKGWFVDRRSNRTQRLYARAHHDLQLPLLYSSDGTADEIPYWLPSPLKSEGLPDEGLLIVPVSYDVGDFRFNVRGGGFSTPADFLAHLSDAFDVLYEEGKDGSPKMMTIILHPHIIGRGSRCFYLEEFIKYISSQPHVWITTREEIATHWRHEHPYDPNTAFGQTPAPPATPFYH